MASGVVNDARTRRLNLQKRIANRKPKKEKMTHERLAELVEEHFNPKVRVFVFLEDDNLMVANAPISSVTATINQAIRDKKGLWMTDGTVMTLIPPDRIKLISIFNKDPK